MKCSIDSCPNKQISKSKNKICSTHHYRMKHFGSYDAPKIILPDGILKICKRHGNLSVNDIAIHKHNKTGSIISCKACKRESSYKYRDANIEKVREKGKLRARKLREENKDFFNDKQRKYFERNMERMRLDKINKMYNLSAERYLYMVHIQDNVCAICQRPEKREINSSELMKLCIDHCHLSESKGIMKVRGLLCFNCNHGLGRFEDNIDFLQSAIDYLKKHEHQS